MARAWELVGRAYPNYNQFGEVESTTVTLTSNTDGYAIFTETLSGDVTDKTPTELIKLARDQYFKKEYADYAVSDAVIKVDELDRIIKENTKFQEELKATIESVKTTADETDSNLKLAEAKRNAAFEFVAQQINGYDTKINEVVALLNGFMEEVFTLLEGNKTNEALSEGSTDDPETATVGEVHSEDDNTGDESAGV